MTAPPPLEGLLVVDLSRMVPGAVVDRMVLDMGARVLKVEDPLLGDPWRNSPPLDPSSGAGAGFSALCRGIESVSLDLKKPGHAEVLRRLARRADVLVESFRPGTMERWGLGYERLSSANPRLVYCALSGYGASGPDSEKAGHDLNFTAASGLLSLLPQGMPLVPLSDVAGGLLAVSSLLAALLRRERTGSGSFLDQSLAGSLMPFLSWRLADSAAGGGGLAESMLSGACPAYGLYECQDGLRVALCAIEPKFWDSLMAILGLDIPSGTALDAGPEGAGAKARIAHIFLSEPRAHWLALAEPKGLPLSPMNTPEEAAGLFWEPSPGGGTGEETPPVRPFLPSLSRPVRAPLAHLGEHTRAVLDEFGIEIDG